MSPLARDTVRALLAALEETEARGLAPVLEDGLVAGNASVRIDARTLVVSASGRRPGAAAAVEVVDVELDTFCVSFRADDATSEPTSDVALHWAALIERPGPGAALHGHALTTDADALRLGLPISERAMEFGTLDEHASMLTMLARWPFPERRAWIRRAHGFFVVGDDMEDARATMRRLVP